MKHLSTAVLVMDTIGGKHHCLFGLKRCDNPGWEFAGGKLVDNESIENCAVREVHEETGLIVNVEFLGCFVETQDYICLLFMGVPVGGELELREPDKHEKWEWFPADVTPQPLMGYVEKALEILGATFPPVSFKNTSSMGFSEGIFFDG